MTKKPRAPNAFPRSYHEFCGTPLYNIWTHAINRCTSPTYKGFHRYGGRGITFYFPWREFLVFKDWAFAHGYQVGLQIDRIDNDGNYEPGNVRFVTAKVNQNNKSTSRLVTAFGETKTVALWVDDPRCQTKRRQLYARLDQGWPPELAITQPVVAPWSLAKGRIAHG